MAYIPFWFLIAVSMLLAIIIVYFYKFSFIDFQFIVMVLAVGFALDMLFCKWLSLYSWVTPEHKGFYSFWVCLLFYPSVALIYIKFLPKKASWIKVYILCWVIALTLFELLVIEPWGIVFYHNWDILPWSFIGYILVLILITVYYQMLKRKID